MVFEALEDDVAERTAVIGVLEDPLRGLAVPHERVAVDLHAVLLGEFDEGVARTEVELAFLGFRGVELHLVFAGQTVEVLREDVGGDEIAERTGRSRVADQEETFGSVAETGGFIGGLRMECDRAEADARHDGGDGFQRDGHFCHPFVNVLL